MAKTGNSVHIGCAFSLVELLAVLYEKFIRFDYTNPKNARRDIFCLSKGHGVMALYAILAEYGVIDKAHLDEYFGEESLLKGLADCHIPGVEVSGGSLGHGITVAVGQAFALKRKNQDRMVYCVIGDGEMNEGSVWESFLFAAHWKLNNLMIIVDANDFQALGRSGEILNCEPMAEKFKAFNFEVSECDGHSRDALEKSILSLSNSESPYPKALIARTSKGKGVSFMQENNAWHYLRLDDATYERAMQELAE